MDTDTIIVESVQFILDQAEFLKISLSKQEYHQSQQDIQILNSYIEEFKIYLQQHKTVLVSSQALMSMQKILNSYKASRQLDPDILDEFASKHANK